jgi:cysteinyl-tRNA synthetase
MFGLFGARVTGELSLYNTASKKKEIFVPLKNGALSMYSCGPTVYSYVHIGNLRAFLLSDLLRRTFEYSGYTVTQVMNITDFGHLVADSDDGEDKMMKGLKREGMEPTMENMFLLASRYVNAFKEDLREMNIKTPHALPRASEHVKGMIAYVDTLLKKDYAYATSDGVYFDTKKFPAYGILGGSASVAHSRTGVSSEKRDLRDFALWKFNTEMGWDAPWGKGFPGWHIECTAMSTQYLGKTFDVHTGGIDHIAIHHNNEIAQAEAANGKPYAHYWLHNEFITIDSTKLSKSIGNELILRQLRDRGVLPLGYRYWLLTGHYRQGMNFTWEAVEGAQQALLRAWKAFADLPVASAQPDKAYVRRFTNLMHDDLDTPRAIALMWELIKDTKVAGDVKRATLLDFDRVLGIGFALKQEDRGAGVEKKTLVATDIRTLMLERDSARAKKDFATSDKIRAEIESAGYTLLDTPEGTRVTKA